MQNKKLKYGVEQNEPTLCRNIQHKTATNQKLHTLNDFQIAWENLPSWRMIIRFVLYMQL